MTNAGTTTNYSLVLYDNTVDQALTFSAYRLDIAGPSGSNMVLIDTQMKVSEDAIAALELRKNIVAVDATFDSGTLYLATPGSFTSYTEDDLIDLVLDTTSSGTVTLNIDSVGIKSVMKINSSGTPVNMEGSDLLAGKHYLFSYDGTQWVAINSTSIDQINVNDGSFLGVDSGVGWTFDETNGQMESADELYMSSSGPHAFGNPAVDYVALLLSGNFTSGGASTTAAQVALTGTITGASGDTASLIGTLFSTELVTQTVAETVTTMAQVWIDEPTITKNVTTITNAVTAYIAGAPDEGTNNYALWVDSGLSRFDGGIHALTSSSGATAITDGDELILENSGNGGLTILSGISSSGALYFGDSGDGDIGNIIYDHNDNSMAFTAGAVEVFRLNTGIIYVNETENAFMTTGITINQDANDDEIMVFKSSDVAHGMTDVAEGDTYGGFSKAQDTSGGLLVSGYKDADGTAGLAVNIRGYLGEAAQTLKSTTAKGVIQLKAAVKTGTTVTDVGADGNLVVFQNNLTTTFIFDAEGSAHAEIEWTTFDTFDDVAILKDLEATLVPDVFGEVVSHDLGFFEKHGILNGVRKETDGKMRGMLNQTRLAMLHTGAISQLADRVARYEKALLDAGISIPQLES